MANDQQALHDLTTVLSAPDLVLSATDGQLVPGGPHGWYSRDRRALARLEIDLVGGRLVPVGEHREGPAALAIHYVVAGIAAERADPKIMVSRHRGIAPAALTESVRIANFGATAANLTLRARVGTDLAGIDAVRAGRRTTPVPPLSHGGELRWAAADITVSLRCAPGPDGTDLGPAGAELTWRVDLPAGSSWSLELTSTSVSGGVPGFAAVPPLEAPQWTVQELPAELAELVAANLADLGALLLADPDAPPDRFAGAGAPWYLTLFGRDALWTARMLLPVAPALAAGTLRTLARRQGTRHDPETEEAPGKILHEARPAPLRVGAISLPAIYYGTIDATPLWVCLLYDAWRAGMPEPEVAALLPNLVAAMDWITGGDADPDGDGLLEYAGSRRGGLANQGWKDSADAIRHADGRHATAPIALCEVQGYAYAAACAAAELADAFRLGGGERWRSWAARLRAAFHSAFWVRDAAGAYPAIALDGDKRPVSGAASNMAHLLGTGLLDADQVEQVTARLAAADLTTGYGLRTLTTTSAAYNPVSYHCGSVWPHDTAVAIIGLAAEGRDELADTLALGLIRAARRFAGRPPELYGVLDGGPPVHYPSACRPQAWAAAAVIVAALRVGRAAGASASGRR